MKKTKNNAWKKDAQESSKQILESLDVLISLLNKNKKEINKDIKAFGKTGSELHDIFESLANNLDTKICKLWDIIDDD